MILEETKKTIIEAFKSDLNVKPGWVLDPDEEVKLELPFVFENNGHGAKYIAYDSNGDFLSTWHVFKPMSAKEAHKHWPDIYPKPEPKYRPMTPEEAVKFLNKEFIDGDRYICLLSKISLDGVYITGDVFISYKDLLKCKWRNTELTCGILEEEE